MWRVADRDVEACLPRAVADTASAELVDVVEVVEEVLEVRVAVIDDRRFDALEHLAVDAFRIVFALEQEWRDGPEQRCLSYARRAVRREVADDLPGAHREAGENHVVQVEMLEQSVQISGEGVVVVTHRWLARLAEPTAVVGDYAAPGSEPLALSAVPRGPAPR